MQEIILTCDWCEVGRGQRRPFAVATLALTNGRPPGKQPTLDLCAKHVRHAERVFRPKKMIGRPPGSKDKPKRPLQTTAAGLKNKAAAAKRRSEEHWKTVLPKVLAAIKKAKVTRGVDVAKQTKLTKTTVRNAIVKLVAERKVVKKGGGRWVTYEVAA